MAGSTWKISLAGDKKLQAAMRGIERKLGRKVIRSAVRDAAKMILREAKALAPILEPGQRVGPSTQMPSRGTLRKGMKVKIGKRKRFHYRINVVFKERSKMGIPEATEDKFYAPQAVESGRKPGVKFGPAEGAKFMINAFLRRRVMADRTIVSKIRTGMFRIWKQDTRRPR